MSASVVEPGMGWERRARLPGRGLWGLPGAALPPWASSVPAFLGERVFLPLLQVAEAISWGWCTKHDLVFSVGSWCSLLGRAFGLQGMSGQKSVSFRLTVMSGWL